MKVSMYTSHKGRELTPENIKEHIELTLLADSGKVLYIEVCQEVYDTINDFKVYFKRARQYKLVSVSEVNNSYINIIREMVIC